MHFFFFGQNAGPGDEACALTRTSQTNQGQYVVSSPIHRITFLLRPFALDVRRRARSIALGIAKLIHLNYLTFAGLNRI